MHAAGGPTRIFGFKTRDVPTADSTTTLLPLRLSQGTAKYEQRVAEGRRVTSPVQSNVPATKNSGSSLVAFVHRTWPLTAFAAQVKSVGGDVVLGSDIG